MTRSDQGSATQERVRVPTMPLGVPMPAAPMQDALPTAAPVADAIPAAAPDESTRRLRKNKGGVP